MEKAQSRIYVVQHKNGSKTLVKALNVHQAIRYVMKDLYTGHLATQEELVESISSGLKVVDATTTQEAPEQMELPLNFETNSQQAELKGE